MAKRGSTKVVGGTKASHMKKGHHKGKSKGRKGRHKR